MENEHGHDHQLETRLTKLEIDFSAHNAVCAERWSEARKAWTATGTMIEQTQKEVEALVALQNKAQGALNFARFIWASAGAGIIAGVAWVVQKLGV